MGDRGRSRKPRQHPTPFERAEKQLKTMTRYFREEFRLCEHPDGCRNLVNIEGREIDDTSPVLCVLHR